MDEYTQIQEVNVTWIDIGFWIIAPLLVIAIIYCIVKAVGG
jgi:hypothetical protein